MPLPTSPIPANWSVPPIFRARMGATAGAQRSMFADGHLLVVLHEIPDPEFPHRRDAKLFWRDPNGRWSSSAGPTTSDPASLRLHVESYVALAEKLESLGDDAADADDWFALVYAATPAHRAARNMHRALQQARELAVNDPDVIGLRDQAGDAERAIELIVDHAREGLAYASAKKAEAQVVAAHEATRAAHRLNLIAATFLPVTAVATIFGMNLSSGLDQVGGVWLFWAVVAIAVVLGLVVRLGLPDIAPLPVAGKRPKPATKRKKK